MKADILLVILVVCFSYSVNTNAQIIFQKTYGGTGSDVGSSVKQTADGGYIITGNTQSFGAGGGDVYLIKTDTAGDILWSKTYGGTEWDVSFSV